VKKGSIVTAKEFFTLKVAQEWKIVRDCNFQVKKGEKVRQIVCDRGLNNHPPMCEKGVGGLRKKNSIGICQTCAWNSYISPREPHVKSSVRRDIAHKRETNVCIWELG